MSGRRRLRDAAWDRAAAVLLLAAAGVAGWWPVLGPGLAWAAPIAVVAALIAARALPVRAGAVLLVLWLPAALLLAGLPAEVLRPRVLGTTGVALGNGLDALTVPARGLILVDRWPLAGALLAGGVLWCAAAMVSTLRGAWTALAFVLLVLPLAGAIALEQTGDSAWHGAVVLAAGLLWLARGRAALTLPATAVVVLLAVAGAQAFGPHDRWIAFGATAPPKPAFSSLDTDQSYGPLPDRRTGRTMLTITSSQPALWRMQVLENFTGQGWSVSQGGSDLPQPAATPVSATVKVVGLENQLVVSPGRITDVEAGRDVLQMPGEARYLRPGPTKGDTYRVGAEVVDATAAQLKDVPVPSRWEYPDLTRTWSPRGSGDRNEDAPLRPADFIERAPRDLMRLPIGQVLLTAARLSAGTTSELTIVRRVEDYLNSSRFRYTTDVKASQTPLLDFLTTTHAGYCQQFAGAAALLLRLAGVPTRVVAGFATGVSTDGRTYDVRDVDAHAWIEVYFKGYGWVTFNPTPASAAATVSPALDVFAPATAARPSGGGGQTGVIAIGGVGALGLIGGLLLWRRRRHDAVPATQLGDLLTAVGGAPAGPATTLRDLRPRLARIGPAVTALADEAERARFGPGEPPRARHPRWRLWRALVADVGARRAATLLARRGRGPSTV